MKNFLIIISYILFSKCSHPVTKFEQMTPPVILVAKSKYEDVTLLDSKNNYVTIGSDFILARTISNSYKKGDTLLYFK